MFDFDSDFDYYCLFVGFDKCQLQFEQARYCWFVVAVVVAAAADAKHNLNSKFGFESDFDPPPPD